MNLRDRLRAVDTKPAQPKAPAAAPAECWQKETVRPIDAFPGALTLPTETIGLMQPEAVPAGLDPRKILYLDTETTGLSGGAGTVAFLVGLGWLTETGFVIRQYVMRDYPEERPLLEAILRDVQGFDAICTFNGKTFDLPLLRDRFIMNRIRTNCLDLPHIDLLQIARRVWKPRLKRCNLAMLEERVLGQPRTDDLPGSQVPERYFTFLKVRDMRLLDDVLRHNEQDIASLCQLLAFLVSLYRAPETIRHGEDLYAMGHALERMKHPAEARRCWSLCASGSMKTASQLRLAQSWRREGQRQEAVRIWKAMIAHRQGGVAPYVELAKHLEHRERDYAGALRLTEEALALLAEPSIFESEAVQSQRNELEYRYARLCRLCGRKEDEI